MLDLACALKNAERKRKVLLNIAGNLIQVSQIKTGCTIHGIPADGLLESIRRFLISARPYARKRKVGIQALKRLSNIAQLPGVLLHPPIGKTVKERGKRKPLNLIGCLVIAIHILFRIFRKTSQQVVCLLVFILQQQALGVDKLIGKFSLCHSSPFETILRPFSISYSIPTPAHRLTGKSLAG